MYCHFILPISGVPTFNFRFFRAFHAVRSPAAIRFVIVIAFQRSTVPRGFPNVMIIGNASFILRMSLSPLPTFHNSILPPMFPTRLIRQCHSSSRGSKVPQTTRQQNKCYGTTVIMRMSQRNSVFLRRQFPRVSSVPFGGLISVRIIVGLLLQTMTAVYHVGHARVIVYFAQTSNIVVVVSISTMPIVFSLVV